MFDSPSQVPTEREPETRRRLLDAAGEVFSERGFRDATVREICARAGANVAAVNYHFRDKENLYLEVLRYADHCAGASRPMEAAAAAGEGLSARERLELFIRGYVSAMAASGKPAWHTRLILREMMEPTPALDVIVNENIRPRSQALSEIIRELLGPGASEERVVRCKFSVIGQCLIYLSGRHVLERLHPEFAIGASGPEAVAGHITAFSLAALGGLRAETQRGGGA